ncbi:MAG: DUF5615 family PIN-like protein [bacterium]
MKIFIDECIWQVTHDFVRQLGHDIVTAIEAGLGGEDDEVLLAQAVSENRAFLTRDMHFSNILLYPPAKYPGIIVLKIKPQTTTAVHQTLAKTLSYFDQDTIQKTLVIVDHNKFRERR